MESQLELLIKNYEQIETTKNFIFIIKSLADAGLVFSNLSKNYLSFQLQKGIEYKKKEYCFLQESLFA